MTIAEELFGVRCRDLNEEQKRMYNKISQQKHRAKDPVKTKEYCRAWYQKRKAQHAGEKEC